MAGNTCPSDLTADRGTLRITGVEWPVSSIKGLGVAAPGLLCIQCLVFNRHALRYLPSVIYVAGHGLRMQVLTCAVHKKVDTRLLCEPALNLLRKKQTTTANAK